jgi:hypothetical protein
VSGRRVGAMDRLLTSLWKPGNPDSVHAPLNRLGLPVELR